MIFASVLNHSLDLFAHALDRIDIHYALSYLQKSIFLVQLLLKSFPFSNMHVQINAMMHCRF
jgi:hypothetical protein